MDKFLILNINHPFKNSMNMDIENQLILDVGNSKFRILNFANCHTEGVGGTRQSTTVVVSSDLNFRASLTALQFSEVLDLAQRTLTWQFKHHMSQYLVEMQQELMFRLLLNGRLSTLNVIITFQNFKEKLQQLNICIKDTFN